MKQHITRKVFFIFCILFSGQLLLAQTAEDRYASNSVLSDGNWIKIKIESTGIYKLTYNDLIRMGISNPKNVKVYGYGGRMLSENLLADYIDDLPQVAIWMSNGRENFGSGDYILFYGKGNIEWSYNKTTKEFTQTQNTYSFDSYYFLTESEEAPLLMDEVSSTGTASTVVTTFADYYLHEQELTNVGTSGREFYGENFMTSKSRDYSVKLEGVISNSALLRYDFITKSSSRAASLTVKLNDVKLKESTVRNYYTTTHSANVINDTVSISNLAENNTINLTYTSGNTTDANVHLNYFRLNYERQLKAYAGVTLFRSTVADSDLGFKISGASDNVLIFDVTDGEKPIQVKGSLSGTDLSFAASNTDMKEYAMVNTASGDIPAPTLVGKVDNQNLHALESKDMVIIVRPLLKKYAQELADIHYEDSGLESLIITPEEIYNEFSSGNPEITAYRRFLKMFYDRADKDADKYPQYLLLFGNGSFDNRMILSDWTETHRNSMLLTYQSAESLNENSTYVTDDYIGLLDDNEVGSVSIVNSALDIGIGRLPVSTESEASNVVSKIKNYLSNKNKGTWKNNIAFLADDAISGGTTSDETYHCEQAERLANNIMTNYPEFIVNKLYMDAYERVITSDGATYPDANKALIDKFNSGLLVFNYTGHGSTRNLAHENILTFSEVQNLSNTHLPLWITATCDYSRFDDYATSAGEAALLNSKGGAIALFTTTRVVFSDPNEKLNIAIMNHVFEKKDGKPLRLGDIMRNAKIDPNIPTSSNKLKFVLLGDPALRLSYPGEDYKVEVTEINGQDASSEGIQIKALADNVIKGRIVNSSDGIASDFSGKLESYIFDSKLDLKTRGNKLTSYSGDNEVSYTDYSNTIYIGKVDITDGEFSIQFVTPKDIEYSNGYGKMSFYAYQDITDGYEAQGSFLNYIVGGMDENATEDNVPPVIRKMYLNKEGFSSGDQVNTTPKFYAEIYDDTGINLSSGIGHNISLVVDGLKSYDLSGEYESMDMNGEKGSLGTVSYQIPELTEGDHHLQFRVWDVWNNSTTATLDFEVVNNYKPTVYDFRIQGNPAKETTYFVFTSDVAGTNVNVRYEVYSLTGALQWVHEESGTADFSYEWDLRGSNGSRLSPGMYVCRMSITVEGKAKASKSEKLIIVGQ